MAAITRNSRKRRIHFLQQMASQHEMFADKTRRHQAAEIRQYFLAALFASLFFDKMAQLAFHGLERVVDDFLERFVRIVVLLSLIGDELVPRSYRHVDSTSIRIAFLVGMVGLLNRNVASVNVITKAFQPGRVLENSAFNRSRFLDPSIGDFNWQLHTPKFSRTLAREK